MMNNLTPSTPASAWAGRILSGLVLLVLLVDALVDIVAPARIATEMAATGFPVDLATPLGIIILVCALAYAIPATSFVGAILISGFAGGAICAHFRLGEMGSPPQIFAVLIGVFTWAGLLLRRPSLRGWQTFVGGSRTEG